MRIQPSVKLQQSLLAPVCFNVAKTEGRFEHSLHSWYKENAPFEMGFTQTVDGPFTTLTASMAAVLSETDKHAL